jgi:prepilin-type N-terminal cleavage/methylation domain-containing protein
MLEILPMRLSENMQETSAHGFTLMELLIAMSILAVVLSTLFAAYGGTFRVLRETESRSDIYEMAGAAAARIIEDLESAVSPAAAGTSGPGGAPALFRGERKETRGMATDSLVFRTRSSVSFSGEGPGEPEVDVHYDVSEPEDGAGLTLYRRSSPLLARGPADGWPLCDRLEGVRFSFVDEKGNELERWDSTEKAFAGRLPSLVVVELSFFDPIAPEAPYRFKTAVALPIAGRQ